MLFKNNAELLRLRDLLPQAVRKAMKLLDAPQTLKVTNKHGRTRKVKNELYDELLSVAETMLVEQYPKLNEAIIRKYLPSRLKEYHLDNQHALRAVTASANRQRRHRGKQPLYLHQRTYDESAKTLNRGTYAPECDPQESQPTVEGFLFDPIERNIKRMNEKYLAIYLFCTEDDNDRKIVRAYLQDFDFTTYQPTKRKTLAEVSEATGIAKSTIDRRYRAIWKRFTSIRWND